MERQYLRHQWSDDHTVLAGHQVSPPPARVLLLADSGDTADSLGATLDDAGYEIQQAATLDEGVTLLEAPDPPLVALVAGGTSWHLHDAIQLLRAVGPPALRVIVVGAADDDVVSDADADLSASSQADDVVDLIDSQLRVAQQIAALEGSRAVMLGTALLAIELNQSMRSELEAQRTLHHELLHRVQTHIGALRDYLELEVRRLPLGIAREAMRGVLYRVRNLSAMYETMAMLTMEDPVDFGRLVAKIGQGVKAMYSPRSKLPVVVEGQLLLPASCASPLMLIVNELVTNAYRHAFPGGRFGTIRVSCGRDDERGWCAIADDGVGMELPPRARPNGGIQLVRHLVRRSLGGECRWESAGQGVVATVRFPLANS